MSNFIFVLKMMALGIRNLIPYTVLALPVAIFITTKIFNQIEKDLNN